MANGEQQFQVLAAQHMHAACHARLASGKPTRQPLYLYHDQMQARCSRRFQKHNALLPASVPTTNPDPVEYNPASITTSSASGFASGLVPPSSALHLPPYLHAYNLEPGGNLSLALTVTGLLYSTARKEKTWRGNYSGCG
ncbi:Ribosome biogenesis protein [Venturia inaequalis]|nr:Ribosome biogenesis protein [Venturia inaequalis]